MCQGAVRRLCYPSKSCHVLKLPAYWHSFLTTPFLREGQRSARWNSLWLRGFRRCRKHYYPFYKALTLILRNKAKLSAIALRDTGDVYVHCHRRRDAARGGASGLQALEFVQGLVEAPLYGGLVAREFGESIGAVSVPGEGPAERSVLSVLLDPHLLGSL